MAEPLLQARSSVCVGSSDGKMERHHYRGYEWTIERGWFMWWCHTGISVPKDPLERRWFDSDDPTDLFDLCGICHEAGWGSFSKWGILRKLRRMVDQDISQTIREREVARA